MKKIVLMLCLLLSTQGFAEQPALKKLRVVLDWFPNPDHAPLVIAKEQGFFKAQGLEVELIGPTDPTDPPKWVAAGKADIGISYEPELMEYIDRGLPLIRIGTLMDKPLDCVVALKESGIKTLADLKGKRLGAGSSGLSNMMLRIMLAKANVSEKDVEWVNVRYNLTQALLSHKIDAVSGLMRNVEVPQLEQMGHSVVTFFPEEYGIPTYSVLIFIGNLAHKNDPRFAGFLTAIKQAVRYLDEHPQLAWQQFIKQYPETYNTVNHEAWFATLPYFAEDPASFDIAEWQRFAKFLQNHKLIKTIQPTSRYAVVLR